MSSSDLTLVNSYSEALFNTALGKGVLDEFAKKVDWLSGFMDQNPNLGVFLNTPSISSEEKEALINRVFSRELHPLLNNFIQMLVRRGRLGILRQTLEAFHARYNAHLGIARATVTTAIPLQQEKRVRVEERLSSFMNKKLVISWKVDPSIVGGLRFLCGDTLIDRTVARGLDELHTKLNTARVY